MPSHPLLVRRCSEHPVDHERHVKLEGDQATDRDDPSLIGLDNALIAQFTWRGEPESALYWVDPTRGDDCAPMRPVAARWLEKHFSSFNINIVPQYQYKV